ncbi:hypothetical protein ACFFRR_009654 [Megaselia abdita]
MQNRKDHNKRLLESPETNTQSKKILMSHKESFSTSSTMDNISPGNTKARDEFEDRMILKFQLMLQSQFTGFAEQYISPINNEIVALKAQNESLIRRLEIQDKKIEDLDRLSRSKNLVFTRLPKSAEYHSIITDLCVNKLKVLEPLSIINLAQIGEEKDKKTVTLLVSFGSTTITSQILKSCRHLRGTNIGISRDISKDEREARNILLILRKTILKLGTSSKVKVVDNKIYIDNQKLTLKNNFFGNDNVDGKKFLEEKFSIKFDEIVTNKQ